MTAAELPPPAVVKLGRLAYAAGWSVAVVNADGPPPSITLRIGRGRSRGWGMWLLSEDGRAKWKAGAANRLPGGHLPTVTSLTRYIEEPAA